MLDIPLSAGGTVVGPLGLFGTTLHEIGHAVVAVVTGLHVEGMVVRSDGSGTTYVSSRSIGDSTSLAVSSAGYLGMVLWGAVFLLAGRWPRASRVVFFVAAAAMALAALLWMDGTFSFGTAVVLAILCVLGGALPNDRWVRIAATVVGGLLAFSGLSDIASLRGGNNDAVRAAIASGWSLSTVRIVWLLAGLVLVVVAIVIGFRPRRLSRASLERPDGEIP